MRIGVMSDSHDNLTLMSRAVELFNREKVDLVLHAGDFVAGFTAARMRELDARLIGVFGNNDGDRRFLLLRYQDFAELHDEYYETELAGRKIVMMHQPKFLEALAASRHYDLIIYGHTHQVDVRQGSALVLNPGECGGWLTGKATVAIVDLESMKPDIISL